MICISILGGNSHFLRKVCRRPSGHGARRASKAEEQAVIFSLRRSPFGTGKINRVFS
ncbi:MAG: hypothetical protein UY23_C0001G0358 [Candidatus Jorgensenbacteria bacterium GW2011_GWA1_48_11]|uniref:Uncharacterized protein n=1 Tax=Candidatus Jorgensenbacteria bacterium GW2011_GWA1_48_11 TaxID=1618660 RepID=A0A0G1UCA6_9BACT|nr:MAG: hypothetical protein UY23_C0001G0358 [Candidatus Jorgensenbacteria bacterium GW2011_GWA1_48_11]KKW12243.1 MAG: hypothetical protein UY51_C0005G0485 [Candidatus Jorgensenbacteria bacterium GW2011_GWB1_49_9]